MYIPLLSLHRTEHGAIEKVVLEMTENTNLANYLLTDNMVVSEQAPAEKRCFYFPQLQVRQGDRVHVVAGSGKNIVFENESGQKTYVFFCHPDEYRWGEGVTPVLQLRQAKGTITITPVTHKNQSYG